MKILTIKNGVVKPKGAARLVRTNNNVSNFICESCDQIIDVLQGEEATHRCDGKQPP